MQSTLPEPSNISRYPVRPSKDKAPIASIELSNQWVPHPRMHPGDDLYLTDEAPLDGDIIAIGIGRSFMLYRCQGDLFIGEDGVVSFLPEHLWKYTVTQIASFPNGR